MQLDDARIGRTDECCEHLVARQESSEKRKQPNKQTNKRKIDGDKKVSASQLGSIVDALDADDVTGAVAKRVIREMFEKKNGENCLDIVERNQWTVLKDSQLLRDTAKHLVLQHESEANAFKTGDENRKVRTMKFFMGKAMKELKGKANPEELKRELEKALQE